MLFYLILIKEDNMINLDIKLLPIMEMLSIVVLMQKILILVISLAKYLVVALVALADLVLSGEEVMLDQIQKDHVRVLIV